MQAHPLLRLLPALRARRNRAEAVPDTLASDVAPGEGAFDATAGHAWWRRRGDDTAASGLAFAGFWYRALALLVDIPLSLAAAIATTVVIQAMLPLPEGALASVGANTAVLLLGQVLYFAGFERSAWKATPGKRWLKLRVTDQRGSRIGWGRALARALLKASIPATMGLSCLPVLLTRRRQTAYDKLCSTLVLRKTRESFVPSWVPKPLRERPRLLAAALSLALCGFSVQALKALMMPRLDALTQIVIVSEVMRTLVPAQQSIEQALARDGRMPATLPADALPALKSVRYAFNAADGTVSALILEGVLRGGRVQLQPVIEPQSKSVVWACAASGLPPLAVPKSCSSGQRP